MFSYTGYDGYTQSYRYNAFDLLAEKTSTGNANRLTQEEYVSGRTLENRIEQLQDATTRYTWDVTRSFGVLLSETTNGQTTDYDYGFERISAISGSTKTEYLYDPCGSVAAELRYDTSQTADSVRSQIEISVKVYNPFGEQLGNKQSGFGYNGEAYDAATGALYLRARYYEPALNRFSQKDIDRGTVTNPKSLNRYLYTWNNPVSYVDLDGQRVALPLNLGGGSSSKKATTTKPSVPKPAPKCTPVSFQEQPVSTSAAKAQAATVSVAMGSTTAVQNVSNRSSGEASGTRNNSLSPTSLGNTNTPLQNNQYSNLLEPIVENPIPLSSGCGAGKATAIQVIVYDKIENGKYAGFRNQAINSPYFDATDETNVNITYVETAQNFIDAWNASDGAENLYIYAHAGRGNRSGFGALILHNQAISFKEDDIPKKDITDDSYFNYSYDHLNEISVDNVYLFICHGAAYDDDHNIAIELAKRSGAVVTANTGSVSYSEIDGKYYARSGGLPWERGEWKTVSIDEEGNPAVTAVEYGQVRMDILTFAGGK